MKKVRIIERRCQNGVVKYIIQQRHFMFRWWWVDAWVNHGSSVTDTFDTIEEAKKNLFLFDGSKPKEKVVYPS